MLDRLIRAVSRVVYHHPGVPQDLPRAGAFGRLKIALVADYFTSVSLAAQCRIRSLTPANYQDVLRDWRPDLLLVESAFHGVGEEWRYRLARQPWYIRLRAPRIMPRLVALARDRGIPAAFWNKDDGAFFEAFLDTARLFPLVFTTDNTCLPRYERALPLGSRAAVLAMPYQPAFHTFTGFAFEKNEGCFVGSYYTKILNSRRRFLDMAFAACDAARMPLHVFDRNSNRLSRLLEFRFPRHAQLRRHPHVPYEATALLYKRHVFSLNVNSVTDSDTMCSRRLLEILACGGILVTNSSPVVAREFSEFCHVVENAEQAAELFARLRFGPTARDRERAAAGAAHVRARHTWQRRLEQLAEAMHF